MFDSPDRPEPPETFGRYRVEAPLGRGGFATVYAATLLGPYGFERPVALKLAPAPASAAAAPEDAVRVLALLHEARLGAVLSHPNLVSVYEFGQMGGWYFVAMERVDGVDLGRMLAAGKGGSVGLQVADAVDVARQVARALERIQEATDEHGEHLGIVHRDLKPANVLVGRSGTVKLADFGLARSAVSPLPATAPGHIRGTPLYMSPEQVLGKPLGPACDVFALGTVLYEMVLGTPLFAGGTTVQILRRIAEGDLAPRLALAVSRAPELEDLLTRCLSRDPRRRPPDAAALSAELEALAGALPEPPALGRHVARALGIPWGGDTAAPTGLPASAFGATPALPIGPSLASAPAIGTSAEGGLPSCGAWSAGADAATLVPVPAPGNDESLDAVADRLARLRGGWSWVMPVMAAFAGPSPGATGADRGG